MGSTSGGSSKGGAGPNVRSSSNQRKRIDARSYIALFKPSSKAEVAGTVGKSEKLSSIPAKTKKNMEKTTSGPAEGTNEARRKRRKTDAHNTARSEGVENLSTPKCLHVKLKCELSKLIKVLELPDNVRILAEQFLEYLLKNHLVVQQPRCMLHAFHIALCWRAASLLKYKLDRSGSLSLAASCLNYEYNEELTELFYEKFGTLKEKVLPMAGERSNKVENNKFSSQKSSSTNLRNDHMFPDQAMDLHGNLSNGAPQGSSSGAEQMVLDGQEVSAPEADREWHLSSEELPNMIVKKKIDLLNNIFSLREKHIHEKQQLEVLELQTQRENQVIKLKEVCSLVLQHIRTSGIDEDTRNDQIKLMIQWFTMLVYAFLEHMRLQLDKFEALQSTTWLKERLMKEKLLQEVTSGQLDQSLDLCIAQTDSNFVIEEFIHFKKQNGDYRADVILSSGCDQLLDDRLIMGNKLVQNIVPSVAISAQEVINASAKAIVGCGGAATSKSVNLPENNINTSSDGIGIQGDCCSSAFPASHDSINQESSTGEARSIERAKEADPVCLESPISACPQGLATLSVSRDVGTEANLPNMYAQQTVGTSQHPPAEVEPTDTLHVMAALDLQPEMQTSALDASPQRMCPDDSSQLNVEPDPPTGLLQEGTTSYHLGGANMGVKDKSVGTVTAVADTCQTGHQPATTPDLSQGGGSYHHLVEARMGVDVNNNGTVCADQAHSSPAMLPFSSEVETCANLSTMSSQQSSDAPSMLPPAGSDSMGMLGAQAEWDMHPDMRPSTSLLDIPLQRMFPDERNQTGCRPDRATDPSEKRETDCPTCTTHNVATLPLSGEAESDNGQTNMPAQQSTSSNAQQSLATWQHPAEEAESTDIPGMVPADDLQPSPPMLDQTAEAARAGMLDVAAAQNLQHEIQRSTTTQIVPLERIDLSNVTVMRSTTVLQSVEPSWYPHTEPAGTLGMVAAPDVLPEMQPSSSVQDQPAEAEGAGTSRTIAAEDLRPEMQSSTTVQHILPERIHLDQRSQISHQPNTTSGPEQLTQLFAVASADFNHLTCSSEPLKNELERLKYCTDFLSKKHEQKKLLLQTEYKQEMEKLDKKYELLLQKEDATYHRMVTELDHMYRKVFVHQSLAENFQKEFTKLPAAQERFASPTIGQAPQSSQQAPARTSAAQTTSMAVSSLATQTPVLNTFHATGPLLQPSQVQLQSIFPGNLYRATSAPLSSTPLRNGNYRAAGAQSGGPASLLQQLRMPPPYALVRRDQQRFPVTSPRIMPVPGVLESFALTSTLAGSPTESMANFVQSASTNPVVMATQEASTLNPASYNMSGPLNEMAGIRHAGAHIAGVELPVHASVPETLPFERRWHATMAGAVLTSMPSNSVHQAMASASNSHPPSVPLPASRPAGAGPQRSASAEVVYLSDDEE